jgi:hypothetical protein
MKPLFTSLCSFIGMFMAGKFDVTCNNYGQNVY